VGRLRVEATVDVVHQELDLRVGQEPAHQQRPMVLDRRGQPLGGEIAHVDGGQAVGVRKVVGACGWPVGSRRLPGELAERVVAERDERLLDVAVPPPPVPFHEQVDGVEAAAAVDPVSHLAVAEGPGHRDDRGPSPLPGSQPVEGRAGGAHSDTGICACG
jgi:hypothetical protein